LPPLQALRVFEAVARLASFRRAGEELLITQSAVSHQIRELERNLGTKLFVRKARSIELTPQGEHYFETVMRAFDLIRSGTINVRRTAKREQVRVSLLPSFAANWLVPRLERFGEAHPEIDLVLDPTLRLADLAADEADVAIRYGDGSWGGSENRLLMIERLTPVISPALLERGPGLSEPRDILNHTLLLPARPYDWEVWADANAVDLRAARTIKLSDYNVVLQAALDGHGVAIGRLLLIADRIRSGALVQPCNVVTSPRVGHWLVLPKGLQPTAATTAFVEWLVSEAAIADQAEGSAPQG
jgi:LysR family transcriptional regulator, glycine cleavage system transcriptional activator